MVYLHKHAHAPTEIDNVVCYEIGSTTSQLTVCMRKLCAVLRGLGRKAAEVVQRGGRCTTDSAIAHTHSVLNRTCDYTASYSSTHNAVLKVPTRRPNGDSSRGSRVLNFHCSWLRELESIYFSKDSSPYRARQKKKKLFV